MKLYISSAMSYRKDHNHPEFFRVAGYLTGAGYEVVNPAALDESEDTTGWKHSDYLKRDIRLLLDCDGIATFGNWQCSAGARAEVELGLALRMPVMDHVEWVFDYEPGGVTP